MSTFAHPMPFGASPEYGGVRFRLWAPAARTVDVVLENSPNPQVVTMAPQDDGWFETLTALAHADTRYRYRIDGHTLVPDPASRFQPQDVDGPSQVVDPRAYAWRHSAWQGRPWHEAVLYELHVGAFTRDGTYEGVASGLDHLVALGATAIELMPLADFAGRRNWGYDGVLPFAPDCVYGTPIELKALIDAAHGRGLMVFLDVVYNHLGAAGNYLSLYAPQFFTDRFATPWGTAIDFSERQVRDFFIHNALYWLDEYRFDGLRLDAVHAIRDPSTPDILEELAATVHEHCGEKRHVHLVLENDRNAAHYLRRTESGRPRAYVAQWNDDIHHALHVLATGEKSGYYADYADRPVDHLARCLAEGFAYQGEPSRHRDGRARGEPSADLPPTAFVAFLQNHDQVGNRAFGERIATLANRDPLRAIVAVMLLAPSPPLLFMGEEWGNTQPFPFFCDFHEPLAKAVREGRRREFARFPEFRDESARSGIPDPNADATFAAAVLDWDRIDREPHAEWLAFYRSLLALRRDEIAPRLANLRGNSGSFRRFDRGGLAVHWILDGAVLALRANLADCGCRGMVPTNGRSLYATHPDVVGEWPPWFVAWSVLPAASCTTG
jgi:malto-oligosyltrehalose trehalohydrolase